MSIPPKSFNPQQFILLLRSIAQTCVPRPLISVIWKSNSLGIINNLGMLEKQRSMRSDRSTHVKYKPVSTFLTLDLKL